MEVRNSRNVLTESLSFSLWRPGATTGRSSVRAWGRLQVSVLLVGLMCAGLCSGVQPAIAEGLGRSGAAVTRGGSRSELGEQLIEVAKSGEVTEVRRLLQAGAEVNAAGDDGLTPLHEAAKNGHGEVVKVLLQAEAEVNDANKHGWTPLHWAAYKGHGDVVQYLVTQGADINAATNSGCTPLCLAAGMGHSQVVKVLLRAGADVNAADNDGRTPLYWAAKNGHGEVVKVLLQAGAEVNAANKHGWTPLHWAAYKGHGEVMEVLLEAGAEVNAADNDGRTPLYWAARNGHGDVGQYLVSRGADINATDNSGRTPLYVAVDKGHGEVVKVLLEAGADVNVKTTKGYCGKPAGSTALDVARIKGYAEIVTLLERAARQQAQVSRNSQQPVPPPSAYDTVPTAVTVTTSATATTTSEVEDLRRRLAEFEARQSTSTPVKVGGTGKNAQLITLCMLGETAQVLEHLRLGADVDTNDKNGMTPLLCAAKSRHEDLAIQLLQCGANPNYQVRTGKHQGRTALAYAVINGMNNLVEKLLLVGATATISDAKGFTPLHWAANTGDVDIVKLLLKHHALADARAHNGSTPLSIAKDNEDEDIELTLEASLPDANKHTCPVCFDSLFDEGVKVVSGPCGHMLCRKCSRPLDTCPICRAEVGPGEWRKVIMS